MWEKWINIIKNSSGKSPATSGALRSWGAHLTQILYGLTVSTMYSCNSQNNYYRGFLLWVKLTYPQFNSKTENISLGSHLKLVWKQRNPGFYLFCWKCQENNPTKIHEMSEIWSLHCILHIINTQERRLLIYTI